MKGSALSNYRLLSSFLLIALTATLTTLLSCSEKPESEPDTAGQAQHYNKNKIHLDVYKDPNCSCCSKWISHIEDNDISVTSIDSKTMYPIKEKYKIEGKHQSCHTGISKEGYIIEGHVPAKYVRQFLTEKPKGAIGLTVPAMPIGSPGMEVDDNFMPYQILFLKKDGSTAIYADIKSYEQQF